MTGKPAPALRSTRLREARAAAGLKQSQLLLRLEQAGRRLGVDVPPRESLKRQVSRWENGAPMSADYRRLFAAVYGMSEEQLGFLRRREDVTEEAAADGAVPAPPSLTRPAIGPVASPAVTPELLDYLRSVLTEYAKADNLVGPQHLRPVVLGQLDFVGDLLRSARGGQRGDLLWLATRYAECAGWLNQDTGDLAAAVHWSGRASEYAQELNDPWLISYVLMRRSNIATDAGDRGAALGLADAALRDGPRLTPGLRAVALRQRAHAAAMWRDPDECARAIDAATTELIAADPNREEPSFTGYCTPAYIAMETASCWVQLGEPHRAISVYERSLADWPAGLERDRGLCLSRLATAHAAAGNTPEAVRAAARAAPTVRGAYSARAVHQLRTARSTLAERASDKVVVTDIDDVLAGLI
jgi:transcriptional regulator with XRE-family HTH domain